MANLGGAEPEDDDVTALLQRLAAEQAKREDAERRAHRYETALHGIRGAVDAAVPPGDTVVRPEDG